MIKDKTLSKELPGQLLDRQGEFFEHGSSKLRPLTMSEVADSIEVHETTVSRAIANKYLQTPHGTFPFKYFFTPGYAGKDGDTVSNTSVKEIIGSIIEKEDASKPLSDRKIVDFLPKKTSSCPSHGCKIPRRAWHTSNQFAQTILSLSIIQNIRDFLING